MKGNTNNKKYLIWFWALFSFPFIFVILLFILISKEKLGRMPTFDELENPEYYLAAQVISEDGVLLGKISIENRTWTEYKDLSPYLTAALISTEDSRYYRHSGIDLRGLGRAAVKTILLGQGTGGGSTITQQLAKQLYPRDTVRNSNLMRKIKLGVSKFKEWQTAVKLERSYTKEEIITMYLNKFDFSYNAIGIRSAAKVYFNTTPDSLNLQQAAVLVGMLKASTKYNPVRNYNVMIQRRNVVISQMVRYGYISQSVADSVMKLPIVVNFKMEDPHSGMATYLRRYLTSRMRRTEPLRSEYGNPDSYEEALWEWNNDPLFGWCNKNKKPDGTHYDVYRDGLKIFTTINSRMQRYAEEALAEHLSKDVQPDFYRRARGFKNPPFSDDLTKKETDDLIMASLYQSDRYYIMKYRRGYSDDSIMQAFNTKVNMRVFSWKGDRDTIMTPLDSIRYFKYFVRSAFMVEEPVNGYVKAYVGGPDFRYFKYDAVTQQKKQVGSTIKPFLYTVAMQNGYSPCLEVPDVPQYFDIPGDSVAWSPRSTGPRDHHGKMVTLEWGLAESENYVSAWLIKRFKPTAVTDLMHKMGVRSFIDPVPSIFLGTSDIKLEEMVGAYGTFANKGVYTRPMYVTRIEDKNGNTISKFTPKIEEVLSENQAYLMLNLLQGVVLHGTGNKLRRDFNLMNQIGGKTGTTQNHSNGWFMAVTPHLVGGVWSGWEDQAIHFETLGEGSGANMALPIMGKFLSKVYADPQFSSMKTDEFEVPSNFKMELDCNKVKKNNSRNDNSRRTRY